MLLHSLACLFVILPSFFYLFLDAFFQSLKKKTRNYCWSKKKNLIFANGRNYSYNRLMKQCLHLTIWLSQRRLDMSWRRKGAQQVTYKKAMDRNE
ncbi:MAG TPA: hypothetical protein DIS88_04550 [Prevotella sp.]|nr:hypothetical protein [Prevotella sp.]